MASPLLDFKDWQHVTSDKDKTTLKHKKHGHVLTLAHNVLSKPHQAQLQALSKVSQDDETNSQAQEAQDQKPREAMAEGGSTMPLGLGDGTPMDMMAEGGHPPCLNPNCSSQGQSHPNCKCYGGMAKGGKAMSRCASKQAHDPGCEYYAEGGGVSPQGQMIRHNTPMDKNHAKAEAKGRMEHERMIKPKMQGLAEGGQAQEQNETIVHPDKGYGKIIQIMAEGGEVLHRGPCTPEIMKAMGGTIPGVSRAMYAEGPPDGTISKEDADPNQGMTPMDQGKQATPGVNININSGPQPQPQESGAETLRHRMEGAGNFIRKHIIGEPIGPNGMPMNQESQQAQAPQPQDMTQRAPTSEPQPQPSQTQAPQPQSEPVIPPQQAPSPQPTPAAPPQQAQPPDPFTQTRMAAIQDMQNNKSLWGQDLKDGHITPKTYESLFADKNTGGKIGTIFGMLLSGAGSGLAHQSNAVFDMMNQQIKNDLQAQEKSKDNAQNYLRLAQQHELNKAQTGVLNVDKALKAKALANIYMNQAALHTLVNQSNKLPTGSPEWQRAQQGLAMLSGQIDNADLNLMDRAAIGQAQFNAFAGPGQGTNSEEAFNQQQKQRLLMGPKGQAMAQFSAGKHLPGWQGEATKDIPEDSRNRINAMSTLDDKGKDVLNYVKAHTGTWNPQTRAVAQQKIEEMKNFYNDSIKGGALTQGRLGWYDEQFAKHPTDILAQLMGSTAKLNEMVNSNAHRRDLEVKYLGLDPKKREGADDSMVSVISKDGKTGKIPKANLQKALKMGYTQQ